MKRALLISASSLMLALLLVVPAWADSSTTTDTDTTDTTVVSGSTSTSSGTSETSTTGASEGVTVTVDATDVGTYQLSLLGSDLDFTVNAVDQLVRSQDPLSIINTGTAPFDVYVSADAAPASGTEHRLSFSDSPGLDQVRWSLSVTPDAGGSVSVTDSMAAGFGVLEPGGSLTLYSYLRIGSGLSYPGVYRWTGTVYAVPES